jgi:AraC family transcriptional activator of pobA
VVSAVPCSASAKSCYTVMRSRARTPVAGRQPPAPQGRGSCHGRPTVTVAINTLATETQRPTDSRSVELQRHLLATLLLWVERWFDAAQIHHRDAADPELQLYGAFVEILERDFTRHHAAGYYAEALRVPQAALSRALAHVTGRTTKELITDRRMLEAARLLRFTSMTVGEVSYRAGFRDQFYFSRAFKRATTEAPSVYRQRVRSRARQAA